MIQAVAPPRPDLTPRTPAPHLAAARGSGENADLDLQVKSYRLHLNERSVHEI
jgi:hypothetical protein